MAERASSIEGRFSFMQSPHKKSLTRYWISFVQCGLPQREQPDGTRRIVLRQASHTGQEVWKE
jgi:hypothetical protein